LLSNSEFTSGTILGERLNISRAAVHKHVQALMRLGIPIHRVPGRGYRLSPGVQLLDPTRIRGALDADVRHRLGHVTVLPRVDSTNNWLLRRQLQSSIHGHLCATEAQSKGRGRRGYDWVASPYRNVMFSIGWEFAVWPESITGLGLAASVAVVQALQRSSVIGVGIKWPNDLVVGDAKLGGILIDVNGESAGRCATVVGIGINVRLEESDAGLIDQPYTDLYAVTGMVMDRNQLIAVCSSEITRMLERFGDLGFQAFRSQWERMHVYNGRRVRLFGGDGEFRGLVSGTSENGALLVVDDNGHTHGFLSGDVRLRLEQ
jgi:BirA family biotin operon repressor/biotin-[acetyl-CoA-carboxylase] ligase